MKLDPFYLIVDGAEWIARLVPLGVKLVQLRIKDRPETELRAEIRRAVEVPGNACRMLACSEVAISSRSPASARLDEMEPLATFARDESASNIQRSLTRPVAVPYEPNDYLGVLI